MDSSNGNGGSSPERVYLDAVQAQLGERVTNLGRRQTDLEAEMRTGFRQIEQSLTNLSANLAERNKPQWQALGVALTFAAILGGLAYMPIREATTDVKTDISALEASTVSRQEMDWRSQRGAEDRTRAESAIAELRSEQVPRKEHDRVWTSYDLQLADKQRQIDELKTAQGSVYGARDALLDMRDRLDRLERDRRAAVTVQ